MKKSSFIITLILGLFLSGCAVALFVHDAEFIFTGNTVNLNEVLENGGEIPRDRYVTYTCRYPLGNYAETKQTISGIIPLPFKSQHYSILCENGIVLSAEVSKKSKIKELNEAVEALCEGETAEVTITGCLQTNDAEINTYHAEFLSASGVSMEEADIVQTYYSIDTTKTRPKIILTYIATFALGVLIIAADVRRYRRE